MGGSRKPAGKPMAQRNSPTALRVKARRAEAARLRMLGLDYRSIAERMGVSVGGAHKLVKQASDEMRRDASEAIDIQRRIELERLDHATRVVMGQLSQLAASKRVNTHAPDQLVRLSERRAKLLGLDAATQLIVQQQLDAKLAQGLMDGLEAIKEVLHISDEDYLRALEHLAAREGSSSASGEGARETEREEDEPIH